MTLQPTREQNKKGNNEKKLYCKVGHAISGNKSEVTMGGEMLLQMLERNK